MKAVIEQILPLWGIDSGQLQQIYSSAWEVNNSYVIKIYHDKKQLERNIKISKILSDCGIPVAKTVCTGTGESYAEYENQYFLLSKKLRGTHISGVKDGALAREMGRAIARLHTAFMKCEGQVEFWDNSLLQEMKGWIRKNLSDDGWSILGKEEYSKTAERLEGVYDYLPKQLIHRDVHFGNFLFFEGKLSGYIDFDLSQRNIRIFDVCYFLAGLLAEETDEAFEKNEWIETVNSVIAGYESILTLSETEKNSIPCVMECIEILFTAYYIGMKDLKHANAAYRVFRFIQGCEEDNIRF